MAALDLSFPTDDLKGFKEISSRHPSTEALSGTGSLSTTGVPMEEADIGIHPPCRAVPFSVLFWKPRFSWGPTEPDTHLMRPSRAARTPGLNPFAYQLPRDLEQVL